MLAARHWPWPAGVLLGPVIAPARQNLHSAGIEPGVHAVSVELDLVEPAGAVRGRLNEPGQLRLDWPVRGKGPAERVRYTSIVAVALFLITPISWQRIVIRGNGIALSWAVFCDKYPV